VHTDSKSKKASDSESGCLSATVFPDSESPTSLEVTGPVTDRRDAGPGVLTVARTRVSSCPARVTGRTGPGPGPGLLVPGWGLLARRRRARGCCRGRANHVSPAGPGGPCQSGPPTRNPKMIRCHRDPRNQWLATGTVTVSVYWWNRLVSLGPP
jgi:hypothetical protein